MKIKRKTSRGLVRGSVRKKLDEKKVQQRSSAETMQLIFRVHTRKSSAQLLNRSQTNSATSSFAYTPIPTYLRRFTDDKASRQMSSSALFSKYTRSAYIHPFTNTTYCRRHCSKPNLFPSIATPWSFCRILTKVAASIIPSSTGLEQLTTNFTVVFFFPCFF